MSKELKKHMAGSFLFILGALAIFGLSLPYPFFVFDDSLHIVTNSKMSSFSIENLIWYWQNSKTPLIFNFWQILSGLFGQNSAWEFRLVNIILHGINSYLVYVWIKKIAPRIFLLPEKQESYYNLSALAGALVFLAHPLHTEVVVWVSAQKDSLVSLCGLLSFIFYLDAFEKEKKSLYYNALTFIFFLIGVLVKPSILPLVLAYLWLDIALFKISFSKLLPRYFHFLILGSIIAFLHLKELYATSSNITFLNKALVAFDSIRLTLFNTFFPFDLKFDYQRTLTIITYQISNSTSYQISIVFVGIFIYLAFISYYKNFWKPFHYAMGLFIILLSINMGFIPFLFQNISTVADRYAYFPFIGFSLLVSWVSWLALIRFPKKIIVYSVLGFFLLGQIGLSINQASYWSSSSNLIKRSVQSTYLSFASVVSLGVALDSEGHPSEAIEYFKAALQIAPNNSEAYEHLFKSLVNANKLEEATQVLIEITNKKLPNTTPHFLIDVAKYYLKSDEIFKAEEVILKAESISKANEDQYLSGSIKSLRNTFEIQKKIKIYNALWFIGTLEFERKNFQETKKLFAEAMKLIPDGKHQQEMYLILDKIK